MSNATGRSRDAARALVLGGYGLIGAMIVDRLRRDGFQVTGLGRDAALGRRVDPRIDWIAADVAELLSADQWRPMLSDVDIVVNAAGALQDSPWDDLDRLHRRAVAALAAACAETGTALVQISAVGARPDASTAFLRTKAAGDDAIRQAGAGGGFNWWILRPGLVLASSAYGGTALLRQIAAVPLVQPLAMPDAPIQTVGVGAVADAVLLAARGALPTGTDCDLVEDGARSLRDVTAAIRAWLGFPAARRAIVLPPTAVGLISRAADGLGLLGWRSPLRGAAVAVLKDGVVGDPARWKAAVGADAPPIAGLSETLAAAPARAEDRLAARMSLLAPLVLFALWAFWLISGVIGFIRLDAASAVLSAAGWPDALARTSVLFWSVVDIALAVLLSIRRTAQRACIGMAAVSVFYLAAATIAVPSLWLDPLGPLVKILPGLVLALVGAALLARR